MLRLDMESLRRCRSAIGPKEVLFGAIAIAGAAVLLAGSAAFRSMMHDEEAVAAIADTAPAASGPEFAVEAVQAPAPPVQAAAVTGISMPPGLAGAELPAIADEATPLSADDPRWPAFVPVTAGTAHPVAAHARDGVKTAAITPLAELAGQAGSADGGREIGIAVPEAVPQEDDEVLISAIREENGSAFNSPVLGPARVTDHVNLRAGPSDRAEVLTVVPRNAEIQAAADCNWCEAVYDGRRGFIYRTFIRRGG